MKARPAGEPTSLFDAARKLGVEFSRQARPTDEFLEINGLRFHYLDWGGPYSTPVLMLHGFAQTCHSWDFTALSLCDRFRVIALDARGHGDSQWAQDGDYSPEAHQRDLHAFVQALGLGDPVLMGLSMGGRSSFTYAAVHPERIKALVIVDAAPEHQRSGSDAVRRFVQGSDELDSIDQFVERARRYNPNPRRSPEQIRGSLLHNLMQLPNGKWTWKYDKALRSPGGRPSPDPGLTRRLWVYMDEIKCPTLVVRGAESKVVSQETAEEMCSRLSLGQLAVVEGAGHLVPGHNPSGFNRAVAQFLDGLE